MPGKIRRVMLSLAIPSLISGCAHQARVEPPTAAAASNASSRDADSLMQAKRVFHVGPSHYPKQTPSNDTYAASIPELSSAFSTSAIIENILARKRLSAKSALHLPGNAQATAGSGDFVGPMPASKQAGAFAKKGGPIAGVRVVARVGGGKPFRKRSSDQWEGVRGNLILASVEHDLVSAQLEQLRRHPGAVDFLMKRAEPYLQYLLEEIDRHGLPADLILVPMVESAFETSALSPKQAAGIWQFIPSTGAQYGLIQTDGYDGRYDVHASTQAAMKYLKRLSNLFHGDWLLALAAYNAGEGAVGRAVEANRKAGGTGTFWELDLPGETEAYVLKIVTLAHAVGNPEAHGFKARRAGLNAYLARVQVGPEARIADVLAAAGIAPEDFYKLNPAFKPDLPPPNGTYHLMMPVDKAEALAASSSGAKVYAMRKVVVQKGETLSILAKRHGVPELMLAEWNGLRPKTPLKAGQELVVYPV
jgi:membrane-bound lytic murein transglycosylase D